MKIGANPRWTLAAVAVTAVFSSAPFAVVAQSPAAIQGFNAITYSDSGGFAGGGTGLSTAVTGEGQVTVNNRRDGTQKTFRLSQKEIGELTEAIQHVDWPTVQGRWYISPGAHDLGVHDLNIGFAAQPRGEGLGELRVDLNGGQTLDLAAKLIGDQAWTRPDLEDIVAKAAGVDDPRQDLVAHSLRPLRASAQLQVPLVHRATQNSGPAIAAGPPRAQGCGRGVVQSSPYGTSRVLGPGLHNSA